MGWLPDIDNSGAIEFLGATRNGFLFCYSGGDYPFIPQTVTITMTAINPPIIIPPEGGSFQYEVELVNVGPDPTFFDVWIMVTLPDSSIFGPLILRQDVGINPQSSIFRSMTQMVPGGAPAGEYGYNGYVGNYVSGNVWSESGFNFSKTGEEAGIDGGWELYGWDDNPPALSITQPDEFYLGQASPNPFNATTNVSFTLPVDSRVRMEIFNLLGQRIAVLEDGILQAGSHQAVWDGCNSAGIPIASGIYILTMQAEGTVKNTKFTGTNKLLLLK